MSKYKKGDKVVIHKDLVDGDDYGVDFWVDDMEYMKESPYVVIDSVDYDGDCYVNKWRITDEMISHKYGELPEVRDEEWIDDLSNEELVQLKSMWESNN